MAERSYPTSEVGAAAESARLQRRRNRGEDLPKSEVRGGGLQELPYVRGQGRLPGAATHAPTPEAMGGCREEQPHFQGAVAAWAQEGLEELSHVEGQEGRR